MPSLGYSLSSEEFDAPTLVALVERGEQAGFSSAGISDHFHPQVGDEQEGFFKFYEREILRHFAD